MKIYTKAGDKGVTGLFTGERVPKDSLRVEAYGTVDETDSALGLARSLCEWEDVKKSIYDVQKLLWLLMADLASSPEKAGRITQEQVTFLEHMIDHYDAQLKPLDRFIVSGDNRGSAALNLARAVVRRAERLTIALSRQESVAEMVLVTLNRLSDLCFILARAESERTK
ncbi:cobalamin adenosyltransferase [Anaerosporomusa subterranea]|uniref:Corrinoid adenosyltransferase n=1 Tax=Anaerosporomusa subterranea TaxID=1794912 RepID=A0A154BU09_ANASB|nr:cob(I)yrinic acid a,c-diamide adenosyltransferase [Anaerosporomusa subterranea]KYZ77412.1 cobalamin adenosyltransferase [Anaerosporomusa subterranea]